MAESGCTCTMCKVWRAVDETLRDKAERHQTAKAAALDFARQAITALGAYDCDATVSIGRNPGNCICIRVSASTHEQRHGFSVALDSLAWQSGIARANKVLSDLLCLVGGP